MSYTFFHSMKKSPPTKTNTWHKHAEKEREGEPDTAHVDHCMGTLDAVGTVGAIARMERIWKVLVMTPGNAEHEPGQCRPILLHTHTYICTCVCVSK